jgi:hypothetical protein
LRLDTRRLEPEDILKLKEWFDYIAPGLGDRFEEDPDQVAILKDVKQAKPRFSEFCSHMIRTSLLFKNGPIPNRPERSTPKKVD